MRGPILPISVSLFALLVAGCVGAPDAEQTAEASTGGFPVKVSSCGHDSTLSEPPDRVVTLNQGATEVVLALGLGDHLAGTAYLDDTIAPRWRAEYEDVPVLAEEYPTREAVLAAEPDFVYASYGSAFDRKVAGTPDELDAAGIASYLSPFGCEDDAHRPAPTFDAVWAEIRAVAAALGEPRAAERLIEEQRAELDALARSKPGAGRTAVWYDSGEKAPLVGAGDDGPQVVLDAVGMENVFADLEGGWTETSWEDVLAADPDVIVLADASWSSAEDKITRLESDPVLSQLRAVREKNFVTVAYSEGTPGVRMVDGASAIAEQLGQLGLAS